MDNVSRWLCAGLTLLLVVMDAGAQVTSIADWPCTTWSERRTSGQRADAPQMWLSGFLSGLATATKLDVLAITDAPQVFHWMDSYCGAHPDESLSTGALGLFNELIRRLPRGPALTL